MQAQPSLLVDAGNQRLKWRWGERSGQLVWPAGQSIEQLDCPVVSTALQAHVASVRSEQDSQHLEALLGRMGYEVKFARVSEQLAGLVCGYQNPQLLGIDRWLAMLACWSKFHSRFLVVSAGTALTLDVVDDSGHHLGGYIIAGLGLHQDALIGRSERLAAQFVEQRAALRPGRDTSAAIANGVLASAVALIERVQQRTGMSGHPLVLTGGDAATLAEHFPDVVHWQQLVLDGLAIWARTYERN